MNSEKVAVYFFGYNRSIEVFGCWDEKTPENSYSFFDLYDGNTGRCLNEGQPFENLPTRDEVKHFLDSMDF